MPGWTFITNHAVVLSLIAKNPSLTALGIATMVGITERAVRRLIADLSGAGYISKKRVGRNVRYSISENLTLRHESHREIAIGDFLMALGWERRQ